MVSHGILDEIQKSGYFWVFVWDNVLHIFNNNYCHAIQFEKIRNISIDDVIGDYVTKMHWHRRPIKHELLHLGFQNSYRVIQRWF